MDASEEAEITLLQLHQMQGELETNSLENQAQKIELTELKDRMKQVTLLLTEKEMAAKNSSEEAELTLLQLHQVQEELEHYFLQSRGKDDLLEKHIIQQKRMKKLISSMLPNS